MLYRWDCWLQFVLNITYFCYKLLHFYTYGPFSKKIFILLNYWLFSVITSEKWEQVSQKHYYAEWKKSRGSNLLLCTLRHARNRERVGDTAAYTFYFTLFSSLVKKFINKELNHLLYGVTAALITGFSLGICSSKEALHRGVRKRVHLQTKTNRSLVVCFLCRLPPPGRSVSLDHNVNQEGQQMHSKTFLTLTREATRSGAIPDGETSPKQTVKMQAPRGWGFDIFAHKTPRFMLN